MKLHFYRKFDPWARHMFVWDDKPPETNAAAPPEAAVEPKASKTVMTSSPGTQTVTALETGNKAAAAGADTLANAPAPDTPETHAEKSETPTYTPEQLKTVFDKSGIKTALESKDRDPAKNFQEVIDAAKTDEDKKIIEWALRGEITDKEKTDFAAKLGETALENAEQLQAMLDKNKINIRELRIGHQILDDAQSRLEQGNTAAIAESTGDEPWMDKLSKLIDRIVAAFTAFIAKITGEKPAENERAFAASPIGGDKKFSLAQRTDGKGVDLKTETAGQKVTSVTAGTVEKIENDEITIKAGESRIVYRGVKDSRLTTGMTVAAGAPLGAMETDTLNFQILDKDNKTRNPAKALEPFTQSAAATTAASATSTEGTPAAAPAAKTEAAKSAPATTIPPVKT